jgi:hypothetical protein
MLVKFLSFVASILGTARYKAILLSCLALLFSSAGIATMALWQSDQRPATSSAVEQTKSPDSTKQGTSQLDESRKQTIDSDASNPDTPTSNTADPKQTPSTTDGSDTNDDIEPAPAASIVLSQSKVTLNQGETSEFITAAAQVPQGELIWEVTAEPKGALVITQETTPEGIKLTIKADQVDKKRTYDVIVTIKDAAQNVVDSQKITVTIL